MRTFPYLLSIPLLILIGILFGCAGDPLTDAASRGDTQTVRTLLDQGMTADIPSAFVTAACYGHKEVVQLLLERGASVDKDNGSITALQCAAYYGRPDMVALLLEAGADADAKSPYGGRTALQFAQEQGHQSVVKVIKEAQGRPRQQLTRPPSPKDSSPPPIY